VVDTCKPIAARLIAQTTSPAGLLDKVV